MKRKKFILGTLALGSLITVARTTFGQWVETGKGFRVGAGEARSGGHYEMKGVTRNVLDLKIASSDTGGNLTVLEQNGFTAKGGPPLHIHLYQDEFFYIVEGEYLFKVGEESFQMKAGDTIFLPRNVQHAFAQLTDTGKVIVSYMPAGKMENFFKATDAWTSPPSREEIVKVFEDHDMVVVGPPLEVD